jgi:hypothetical protein
LRAHSECEAIFTQGEHEQLENLLAVERMSEEEALSESQFVLVHHLRNPGAYPIHESKAQTQVCSLNVD